MATPRTQRIGIWVIAIVMVVGTIFSFVVIVLENQNAATQQAATDKANAETQAEQTQAAQTNADNSIALTGYSAQTFDASNVNSVQVETLVQGTGATIKSTDSINVSYFGWTSNGVIFDSSMKKDTNTDTPITFALNSVISGWTTGLTGVKVGSVVRLTIPSDDAYGSTGSGVIPANAPLQFIVDVHSIDNSSSSTSQ